MWFVARVLASASVLCLSQVLASAQIVELGDFRLLSSPEPSGQSAVFELINITDRVISQVAVSCNLLDEAGRAIAVKVIRFRNVGPDRALETQDFPWASAAQE